MTLTKNLPFIIVIILVAVAIILASYIYRSRSSQKPTPTPNQLQTTQKQQPQQPVDVTVNEREVLNFPGPNASDDERKKYAELVNRVSKETTTLEIKNCEPSPLGLKVKEGTEIKVKNNDSVKHKLIVDEKNQYDISASSSNTIKLDFGKGPGVYGYTCDPNAKNPAGIFYIIP